MGLERWGLRGHSKLRIAGSDAEPLREEGHRSEPTGDSFRDRHVAPVPTLLDLRGRESVGWENSEPINEPLRQTVEHSESVVGAVERNNVIVDEVRDETVSLGQENAVAEVHEVHAEFHGGGGRVGG